jgi:AraC-like DNA-binding protein
MPIPEDGNYNNTPYTDNLYVMLWDNKENWNFPSHWHSAMEIIMPTKGCYEVELRNKTYLLRENDILFISSMELHSINVPPKSEKGQRIILMFEPTILLSLPGLLEVVAGLYNLNYITPEKMPDIHKDIQLLLKKCRDEVNNNDDIYRNIAIYARIIEIFVILARYQSSGKFPHKTDIRLGKRQDYIVRLNVVFEYVNNNLSKDLTLEAAAKLANFSKFHFERIFRLYTNMPFYQFVENKRITRSETLLLNPKLSIIDVAMDSGFRNVSSFNRVFKKIKHCTPSEYRKNNFTPFTFESPSFGPKSQV